MDPFADVVSKVTYFTCLLAVEVLPLWFLLIVLYREFGIILIRMILYRTGTALGARSAGKIKTWFYAVAAALGLFVFTAGLLGRALPTWLSYVMIGLLIVTSALSIYSFIQYFVAFLRHRKAA
jgi:CDP-diacylglycerol--glycerol-3-phosphate 3-phosphatidyltransferase